MLCVIPDTDPVRDKSNLRCGRSRCSRMVSRSQAGQVHDPLNVALSERLALASIIRRPTWTPSERRGFSFPLTPARRRRPTAKVIGPLSYRRVLG